MLLFIIAGRLERYINFVYSKCVIVVLNSVIYTNNLETVNLTPKVSF